MAEITERVTERDVCAAAEAVRRAEKELTDLVARCWPVGMYVEVPYGNGYLCGFVVGHSPYSPKVRLELDSTGRDFWVGAYHLYKEVMDG